MRNNQGSNPDALSVGPLAEGCVLAILVLDPWQRAMCYFSVGPLAEGCVLFKVLTNSQSPNLVA